MLRDPSACGPVNSFLKNKGVMQGLQAGLNEKQKANLSCEQCQQRKTKCDKAHPCGACRRASIVCTAVQRRRLPRGRTATAKGRNVELKGRIARLENLLSTLTSGSDPENNLEPDSVKDGRQEVSSSNFQVSLRTL